jgi:hypothetical protein
MYHVVTLTVRHTSDNRHFSDEFSLRKLPKARFVRKLFYSKKADHLLQLQIVWLKNGKYTGTGRQ